MVMICSESERNTGKDLNPQSHRAYDQVSTQLRQENVRIMGKS